MPHLVDFDCKEKLIFFTPLSFAIFIQKIYFRLFKSFQGDRIRGSQRPFPSKLCEINAGQAS